MKTRLPVAIAWAWLAGVAACAASERSVILYEGPDRPGGEEVEGPAPPSDFRPTPSERLSKRVVDTNGDKRGDRIEYLSSGQVIVTGEDTNYDGKIDVYRKVSNGSVVEEVRDRDFDGVFDERRRDANGDGKLDSPEQLPPK